jgi:hypothetical protein
MSIEPDKPEVTNQDIEKQISRLAQTVQSLSNVLSTHVRSNLDTLKEIREYIGSQIAYRSFREGIEENQLKLQIEEKNLEIRYKEKLLLEETTESDALKLERDKLRLEMETLKKNLEVVQLVKNTTQEKMKAMQSSQPSGNLPSEAKKTFLLTTVAFLTTSVLGGVLAIIVFVIRLYIQNNP